MNGSTHLGRCLCGAVRYRIKGGLRDACVCHCESCRRATGAPCVAWGTVGTGQLAWLSGQPASVASSPGVARGFCAACGTHLTYTHVRRAGQVDITLASLDEPGRVPPKAHIWVQDKLPWFTLADGLPQYHGAYGEGPVGAGP